MSNKVIANLRWFASEEGGRAAPPPGPKYSTVARFEASNVPWKKEAWSLVITFIEQPDSALSHRVEVKFLAETAPEHLLSKGSVFELMEGERAVARGIVISDWS